MVVDGVVYTQNLESDVFAIDLKTGKVIWEKKFESPDVGPNGVVVEEGMVFGATTSSAFALDAKTGEQLWEKELILNKNEGIDQAPGFDDGVVYVSTNPTNTETEYDGGSRGVLWAMDAKTGATKWKFDEVPKNLWGDPKVNSGGGMWTPPSFDEDGNVYIGIANPAPYEGEAHNKGHEWGKDRPGPNLYTDSVVKLDAETGKLQWYYQLTPHDIHDRDVNNSPMLTEVNGKPAVIDAGKAGVAFAVDQETGQLLWKTPVGQHNGHEEDNLFALRKEYSKLESPENLLPGTLGGVETEPATDGTTAYFPIVNAEVELTSHTTQKLEFTTGSGEMDAVDQATGKIKWRTKLPSIDFGGATVVNDLVFTTTYDGTLYALNKETGSIVWKAKLPAGSNAPVMVVGDTVITGAGVPMSAGQTPELVAFRLGATAAPKPAETTKESGSKPSATPPKGGGEGGGTVSVAEGESVFKGTCSVCHTLAAAGSNGTTGPNLDELEPSEALVEKQVTNGGGGMPAFGGQLSKTEIESVAKYVSSVAGTK